MTRYATTYLLALSFLVAELHCFWHNADQVQNWILFNYKPMEVRWNIKYASDQLLWIMAALAMLGYGRYPNRVNKTSVKVFVVWVIIDTLLYFVNFKESPYGMIYFCLAGLWVFIYHRKPVPG